MLGFITQKFTSLLSSFSGGWRGESLDKVRQQLRTILIEADVPFRMVDEFSSRVISRFEAQSKLLKDAKKDELLKTSIYKELLEFLGSDTNPVADWPQSGIVLFMGLQGAGKTTTVAKIGHWLSENRPNLKDKIFCVSLDFQRPAAIGQLEIMAGKAGINFIKPVENNFEKTMNSALEIYRAEKKAFLLVDSAGRLNIDKELMAELERICQISKPEFKVLVLDSMTGQQSIDIAKDFDSKIGIDRTILTKMDSDSRAGCAIALRWITQKPVSFVANGEKIDDLEVFVSSRVASRIMGSGDIATLSEKIERQIEKTDGDVSFGSMASRIMNGNFTLKDFLKQIELVNSIGSIGRFASYIPGMGSLNQTQVKAGEKELADFKSIIQSMTEKERVYPGILDKSRKIRVAKGSGRGIDDVERLLQKFEQSKRFAKLLSKLGR